MKFRMVDRILQWEPCRGIRGIKTVSFEEYELKSAFGGERCLPESLMMESLFQLGNWLIMLSSSFSQMGLVVRMNEFRFIGSLRPGQCLLMEVNARSWRPDGMVLDGRALVGDTIIANGKGCLALPVDLSDYYDPDDLRVLFSEIYKPDEAEHPEAK